MKRLMYGDWNNSLVLFLIMMVWVAPASAAHYQFSQSGFSGNLWLNGKKIHAFANGKISGSFDGVDKLDKDGNNGADGVIYGSNSEANEISNFTLTFSGNPYFDSFFSVTSIPYEAQYVQYNIAKNELQMDLYWEGSYQPDFSYGLTGDVYENFTSFTDLKLNVDGKPSTIHSGVVYAFGQDKDGNPIDGYRDLNITMDSDEKTVVSVAHAPLPGAFYLFAACLSALVIIGKKNRLV